MPTPRRLLSVWFRQTCDLGVLSVGVMKIQHAPSTSSDIGIETHSGRGERPVDMSNSLGEPADQYSSSFGAPLSGSARSSRTCRAISGLRNFPFPPTNMIAQEPCSEF